MTDAISRSNLIKLCRNLVSGTVSPNDIARVPGLDVAQIVTNGQDTTYLRVKSLDELRGRIVIDEESGNRCAMYYEEAENFAPVVHARWVRNGFGKTRCSNCHIRLPFRHCYDDEDGYEWDDEIDETPWCMHCGARMDGEADVSCNTTD